MLKTLQISLHQTIKFKKKSHWSTNWDRHQPEIIQYIRNIKWV